MSKSDKERHKKNKNKYLSKYSSKISRIYIEIHNFHFRHGVFEGNDENFIGRNDIRNRLRAIFTHSDSNSGTYLLTGQRGVGKTSLINKVIAELSGKKERSLWQHIIQYLLLFSIILLITIFDRYITHDLLDFKSESTKIYNYNLTIHFISILLFLVSCTYVSYHSLHRIKLKYLKPKLKFFRLIRSFFESYIKEMTSLHKKKALENRLMKYAKYTSIITFVVFISKCYFNSNFIFPFLIYGFFLLWFSFFNSARKALIGRNGDDDEELCKKYRNIILQKKNFVFWSSVYPIIITSPLIIFGITYLITCSICWSLLISAIEVLLLIVIGFPLFFWIPNLKKRKKPNSYLKNLYAISYEISRRWILKHRSIKKNL